MNVIEIRVRMLHEVELLEELPYYRSLARPRPPGGYSETPIAIIAPDVRTPSKQQSGRPLPQNYAGAPCLEVLLSAAAWSADVASDLAACATFFAEGRPACAVAVAACVLLSALATNACSLYWYLRSYRLSAPSVGRMQWVLRAISHALLLGLLHRFVRLLGKQSWEETESRKRKQALKAAAVREERQAALLGLLHSLLESAPQLLLQLYTLAQRKDTDALSTVAVQGSCVLLSLFQSTWSIASYNNTLHRTTAGKQQLAAGGKLLHFLWHFCTLGSRACTLALFAREYHFWLVPFCIGHWGVMSVWVMHQQTHLCRKGAGQCREYAGNMVTGLAYVIYFLNVKAEPTRYKYSAYYAVVFAENCVLMTLWFLKNDPGTWYHIPALVAVFSSFTSGMVFMLFYYGFCHQNKKPKNDEQPARCC